MKKRILNLLVGAVLLISMITLSACVNVDLPAPTESDQTTDHTSDQTTDHTSDQPRDDAPYELAFASNGDGTCYVSEIKVNPDCREKFVLEIPATSPDGDKVISVKPSNFSANVPAIISKSDFDKILAELLELYCTDKTVTVERVYEEGFTSFPMSFELMRIFGYYTYIDLESTDAESLKQQWLDNYPICEKMPVWVLAPTALTSGREMRMLGEFLLDSVGYTSFDCIKAHETVEYSTSEEGSVPGGEFISEIRLASTDTEIDFSLYSSCWGLEKLTIPDGITEIPDYAFDGQGNLVEVTIPGSVTHIGSGAFVDCQNLTDISYQGTVDEWAAVEKAENWKRGSVPVHCTDGDAA